jgi:hypothetical protein
MKIDTTFGKGLTQAQLSMRVNQDTVRTQVRHVCCDAGVPVMMLTAYYSFALEVNRLKEMDLEGETLALEVAPIEMKWAMRGLSQSVLEAIKTQVFHVPALVP